MGTGREVGAAGRGPDGGPLCDTRGMTTFLSRARNSPERAPVLVRAFPPPAGSHLNLPGALLAMAEVSPFRCNIGPVLA